MLLPGGYAQGGPIHPNPFIHLDLAYKPPFNSLGTGVFFFRSNTFIEQGCIKNDSKDTYNATKDLYLN